MTVFRFAFDEAQDNFKTRNRFARWFTRRDPASSDAVERVRQRVFRPGVNVTRKIKPDDTIFTIGSCFARQAERTLHAQGYSALSLVDGKWDFDLTEAAKTGFVNRYNTGSILRELEWASGERDFPEDAIVRVRFGRFVDLHSHPVHGAEASRIVIDRRRKLTEYFSQVYQASLVTITLGLIECWYDKSLEDYINFAPIFGNHGNKKPLLKDPRRFEFRVLGFEENMENLERIFALLKRHNPGCHIIVTVSPVSLMATFSHRDVVVANCMSKSMLRACAETWQSRHPDEIDYFPSYEMATMSDRRLVWQRDGMHIQPDFASEIIAHFADSFIEKRPAEAAA